MKDCLKTDFDRVSWKPDLACVMPGPTGTFVYKPISIGLVGNDSKSFVVADTASEDLQTDFDRVSWKQGNGFKIHFPDVGCRLRTDFDRVSWKRTD